MIVRLAAGLFGAGIALRNSLYDHGQLRSRELAGPVISIGNISVGGSGKTPFTIALGELLKKRGIPFDVLSRGYRRETRGPLFVDPAGTARQFGDEPLLIARELGVDVIVGESRYAAGKLAERKFGPRLHLLDDGFQHRKLARQFDIVLVSEQDLHGTLLPAGHLREPASSLPRADALVTTVDFGASTLKTTVPIWRTERKLSLGAPHLPSVGRCGIPERPLPFCGIARPHQFFSQLRALGITSVHEHVFRDHHRYTAADLAHLDRLAVQHRADSFITTAKDAINLEAFKLALPLHIAHLSVTIFNPAHVLDTLLTTLRARGKTF